MFFSLLNGFPYRLYRNAASISESFISPFALAYVRCWPDIVSKGPTGVVFEDWPSNQIFHVRVLDKLCTSKSPVRFSSNRTHGTMIDDSEDSLSQCIPLFSHSHFWNRLNIFSRPLSFLPVIFLISIVSSGS